MSSEPGYAASGPEQLHGAQEKEQHLERYKICQSWSAVAVTVDTGGGHLIRCHGPMEWGENGGHSLPNFPHPTWRIEVSLGKLAGP